MERVKIFRRAQRCNIHGQNCTCPPIDKIEGTWEASPKTGRDHM